jgi:hypothetical protein
MVRLEEFGKLKKCNDPIGFRAQGLLVCSIVPQLTTLRVTQVTYTPNTS